MRGGRAKIIVGAGAALTGVAGADAAQAAPPTDSPTAAQQRQIREDHLAQKAPPAPAPPPRPVTPPAQQQGSDGLSPGQRRLIDEDRRASDAVAPPPPPPPAPKPEPAPQPKAQPHPVSTSEPEPAPQPVPAAQRRGPDGPTPGQRRLTDEDRRAAAATPAPPAAPPAQPRPVTTSEPEPTPEPPLTPGQRRLIDEDRRAAEATPPPPPAEAEPEPVEAEVMNWNLGRGASWKHGQGTDPNEVDEVAETIAEELPDVVTLQEVYTDYDLGVGTEGSYENDVDKIVRLVEEQTGVTYDAARGEATTKAELDDNIWRDGLVGNFGNVVLSREPITDSETEQLPSDGDEGRVTQTVVTTVDGVEVTVVNTHVTTGDNDHQPEQLEEAFDRAGEPSGPVIFAGDFNARASTTDPLAREQDLTRLTERLGERCDGSGRNAIDQVYGSEGVTGGQRPGFECGPSDHPYQVVDVEIPRD